MIIKTIYLKSLDEGKIDNGGVVGLDTSNGFKEGKVLKGASNGERSKRVISDQNYRPSEPDTVEAHGLYSI